MNIENVVVRDFTGNALIRCVCHSTEKKVFLTSEKGFLAIKSGDPNLFPIGFDRRDVFVWDGKPLPKKIEWSALHQWLG
jgi:hypothetical protein